MTMATSIFCLFLLAAFAECGAVTFQSDSWKKVRPRAILEAVLRGAILSGAALAYLLFFDGFPVFSGKMVWLTMAIALLFLRLFYLMYSGAKWIRIDKNTSSSLSEGRFIGVQAIGLLLAFVAVVVLTIGSITNALGGLAGIWHTGIDVYDVIGIILAIMQVAQMRLASAHAHSYFRERV